MVAPKKFGTRILYVVYIKMSPLPERGDKAK